MCEKYAMDKRARDSFGESMVLQLGKQAKRKLTTGNTFWKMILKNYKQVGGSDRMTPQLNSKWKAMNKQMNTLNGYWTQAVIFLLIYIFNFEF
ncbi:hypothetical protein HanIR_Chr03g0116991 [Helianthus annuus]|nr:hypothetical protein HanIR_Chr03g0116991 [Helianthus annuus]